VYPRHTKPQKSSNQQKPSDNQTKHMKKINIKYIGLLLALVLLGGAARAQVKIGANPATIGASSGLEVEAANGKKVIVNKADGSVVIENVPAGISSDKYMTVDASGNVRAIAPPTSTSLGVTQLYRGTMLTEVLAGACPTGTLGFSGYLTGVTCSNHVVNSKSLLTFTFATVGTSNYDVFLTANRSDNNPVNSDLGVVNE